MGVGEAEHGLHEVFPRGGVEPGGAYDDVVAAALADELFAKGLALAID